MNGVDAGVLLSPSCPLLDLGCHQSWPLHIFVIPYFCRRHNRSLVMALGVCFCTGGRGNEHKYVYRGTRINMFIPAGINRSLPHPLLFRYCYSTCTCRAYLVCYS